MSISPELLNGLFALSGALIGALPGLVSTFISKRSEERKQFKELVVKTAIESWKTHLEHSQSRAIMPLEHYIIHTAMVCEVALAPKRPTPQAMKNHLEEITAVVNVLVEHATTPPAKKQT